MLTVIIPIDLRERALDIILKAIKIAKTAENSNVTIIFGHNERCKFYDKIFKKQLKRFKKVEIVSRKVSEHHINTSSLRNIAFSKVNSENLVILDVDIWPDFELLIKYADKINSNQQPFYILPCLYLSKYGSKRLSSNKLPAHKLKDKFYKFSRKEFLHIASPSSVIIMKSTDYSKLNGFDMAYNGHGYEDFDFIVRLASHYNKLKLSENFLINNKSRSPLFLEGFRRYLGKLCLDVLIEKDMVFHLYHKKKKESKYYKSRPDNFNLFVEKHKDLISSSKDDTPTLIIDFINLCVEKKINIYEHAILFDNKPGHIDRFDTFRRRLNFILNR